MKTLLKATLLPVVIAGAILATAWVSVFLYWHVRITLALRDWEKDASSYSGFMSNWRECGAPHAAAKVLNEAGCRGLPYLVRALGDDRKNAFKEQLASRTLMCICGPGPRGKEALGFYRDHEDWEWDSREQLEARFRSIQSWWREHGGEHHQWWRIWSSQCNS